MAQKTFKGKSSIDIKLTILEEYWLDDDTYVIIFNDISDNDGELFHIEVEYHKDEDRVTFTSVYEYENVNGIPYLKIGESLHKEIEEYILQQVNVLDKDSMLVKRNINVELTLGVPKDMTIGEFQEWLNIAYVEVNRLVATKDEKLANKVKILAVENKGAITN